VLFEAIEQENSGKSTQTKNYSLNSISIIASHRMKKYYTFCQLNYGYLLLFLCGLWACESKNSRYERSENYQPPYEISMELSHNPQAFTQGLLFHEGKLYESTGGDESWIAEVDLATGQYHKKVALDNQYFGEGITILNNKVYQLTWQNKTGFVYEYPSFEKVQEFSYDFEGWGITHDNHHLIVSDGTEKLYYLDTLTLEVVDIKYIKENGMAARQLNELEYINGFIYANEKLILKKVR